MCNRPVGSARPDGMRHLLALGVVIMLGVAACGRPSSNEPGAAAPLPLTVHVPLSGPGPPPAPRATPGAGPELWASFPVDRKPRPIVLLSPPPAMAGFTTGAAKLAALNGNLELSARLPPAPATVTAQLPDGPADFPALAAERAFADLSTALRASAPPPDPTDALPVTRVELGTAEFQTDRGPLGLPAWLFHPVDALGPIAWPALPPDAFWAYTPQPGGDPPARLAADGTLTVPVPAPPSPCPGAQVFEVDATVTETASTVTVVPRSVPTSIAPGPSQPSCGQRLVLQFVERQVRLAAPLGNRVLIGSGGRPVAVTR
jgi:hypothetical protein